MSITSNLLNIGAQAYLSWVEIDLGAIRANHRRVREMLPPSVAFFPVVKADAYGHDAVEVVRVLETEGVQRVCVARVEEAVQLRQAGISISILVFTPPLLDQARIAAEYDLEVVVCDKVHIDAVNKASQPGKSIPGAHIKADIGMGRIGARPADVPGLVEECRFAGIPVIGVMSHFPCADAQDRSSTLKMIKSFETLKSQLELAPGTEKLYFHVANTAATLRHPSAWFNAIRSGISLYGQYPSADMERPLDLTPAMTLKTRIVYIKDVPPDTPISYSHTYKTSRSSRIATLALGYADGYPRHASNLTEFLVHGNPAPQVGRICMDQLMIDVTDIPEANMGDIAVAFGRSAEGIVLAAEDVAARFDSLGYELTSRIGKRLPRFFVENDKPLNKSNQHDR